MSLSTTRFGFLPNEEARRRVKVEKTIWSSPAGKKRLAKRLVAMLPPHSTYVEPFVGSGAVLFEKEPAKVEVVNDADGEIADAYRILKGITPAELKRLQAMKWTGDRGHFKKTYDSKPTEKVGRLYKFLYTSHFSYGRMRHKSFDPNAQGKESTTPSRVADQAPRLRNVRVFSGDFEPVVRKFDSKTTAFFLDPPYAGYDATVGESQFDEERFFRLLKSLKGKFLLTYGTRGKLPGLLRKEGYPIRQMRPARTIGAMRGVGGPKVLTQLVVSNYEPAKKALDWRGEEFVLEPWEPEQEHEDTFRANVPILKADERFVLGVVLEPETEDAQGDIYSADEVRKAAHKFLEEYGGLGLMHQMRVNDEVKILESYVAPSDFAVGDATVKEGTWLLGVHILSDDIWGQVKDGSLTGFSIGGSAQRTADAGAKAPANDESRAPAEGAPPEEEAPESPSPDEGGAA
jgi:DNA adenine methylase